jgi:hypothetical protein
VGRSTEQSGLPLREGLVRWCDKELVEAVRAAEKFFNEVELRERGRINLGGGNRGMRQVVRNRDAIHFGVKALNHTWECLLEDFRRRIEEGQLFLCGVQTLPKRYEVSEPIPSGWATDFEFDFFKNVVRVVMKYRYVAVLVSTTPPESVTPEPPTDAGGPPTVNKITPEMVSSLDDETILKLLEEHAKRVVENESEMIHPRKVSLAPIIRRKMRQRANNGEIEASLAAEAKILSKWIAERVPSFQAPTPASLENALRVDYRTLKAQSKGIIAS